MYFLCETPFFIVKKKLKTECEHKRCLEQRENVIEKRHVILHLSVERSE